MRQGFLGPAIFDSKGTTDMVGSPAFDDWRDTYAHHILWSREMTKLLMLLNFSRWSIHFSSMRVCKSDERQSNLHHRVTADCWGTFVLLEGLRVRSRTRGFRWCSHLRLSRWVLSCMKVYESDQGWGNPNDDVSQMMISPKFVELYFVLHEDLWMTRMTRVHRPSSPSRLSGVSVPRSAKNCMCVPPTLDRLTTFFIWCKGSTKHIWYYDMKAVQLEKYLSMIWQACTFDTWQTRTRPKDLIQESYILNTNQPVMIGQALTSDT